MRAGEGGDRKERKSEQDKRSFKEDASASSLVEILQNPAHEKNQEIEEPEGEG